MMLEKFISEYNGRVVSFDNVPAHAGQSPQLIAQWCTFIGLPFQWANGSDWWDDSDETFLDHWDKVVNDRKNADQLPKPGDIVVFDSSLPGSGNFGHLSVFLSSAGPNSWTGFDANWGGKSAHVQSHNWSYVLGWFSPKDQGVVRDQTPTPIADEAPSLCYEVDDMEQKTVTLKTDALLYNLNSVDWEEFQHNPQSQGHQGEDVVVKAIARHRLGGTYYMPAPDKPYGYRVTDCDDHDRSGQVVEVPEEKVGKKQPDKFPKGPVLAPVRKPTKLERDVPRYASMGDAINGVNSTGTLAAGDYFIYKTLETMWCLSDAPGNPTGWWINPDDLMSPEEKQKLNWRTSYKPFRDQYGTVAPRYYRALNDDPIEDLEGRRRGLAITRSQPILIRGWFVGPDGIIYGRPDDCVSKGELQWFGARRANLERIPDPVLAKNEEPEMIIEPEPLPTFRDKLVSILPPRMSRVFDIVKPKI